MYTSYHNMWYCGPCLCSKPSVVADSIISTSVSVFPWTFCSEIKEEKVQCLNFWCGERTERKAMETRQWPLAGPVKGPQRRKRLQSEASGLCQVSWSTFWGVLVIQYVRQYGDLHSSHLLQFWWPCEVWYISFSAWLRHSDHGRNQESQWEMVENYSRNDVLTFLTESNVFTSTHE